MFDTTNKVSVCLLGFVSTMKISVIDIIAKFSINNKKSRCNKYANNIGENHIDKFV